MKLKKEKRTENLIRMSEKKDIWDLNDLLKGQTIKELEKEIDALVKKFQTYREKLTDDITPETIKEVLLLKEELKIASSKVGYYYGLAHQTNTADTKILGKMSHFDQKMTEYGNKMLFFNLWFIHLDDKIAENLLNSPVLIDYKYYLKDIRKQKPHTKSEEIEQVISLKSITGGDAFASLYEIFTGHFKFSFNGKDDAVQEEVTSQYHSTDSKIRKEAYDSVYGKFGENSVVISEMYKNIVLDWYNESIKIRKYSSPIAVRNISNDIEDKAVQALLNVVRKNSKVFQKYFKLKYEILKKQGQEFEYSRYHQYAPYISGEEKNYDYDTSKKITLDIYKDFDEKFYEIVKSLFDKKHIHSHPKQNKRAGAFCAEVTNKIDPYIMLNHAGTLRDVFTMVHEFGHGIHDVLAMKQNNLNMRSAIPMAETASIFGENILADVLLEKSDSTKEKIFILIHQLDSYWASITRQAFFVIFEIFAHENIPKGINKDELDEKYMELLKEQFGDMEIPEVFKYEWNYITHIHASPFYCYAYAWGNLLVLSLIKMYKKEGDAFKPKYFKILEAGGSMSPADILKEVDIDPSKEEFWEKGFEIIREKIETLKELSEKV